MGEKEEAVKDNSHCGGSELNTVKCVAKSFLTHHFANLCPEQQATDISDAPRINANTLEYLKCQKRTSDFYSIVSTIIKS